MADLDCKVLNRTAIMLFGRLPVPGKVKTRLARTIGDRQACECYKEMCENVVKQAVKSTASVIFMCSEKEEVPEVKKWLEPFAEPAWKKIAVRAQVEGGLGERITAAFADAFEDGCDEVIVAGTDVPDLSLDTFTLAFLHLQSFDVVIGPSEDDGYYLIGLHRKMVYDVNKDLVKKLFKGIHWSTSLVYRDQVNIAYKLELSVCPYKCLPVLIDVDTVDDATRWLEKFWNYKARREAEEKKEAQSASSAALALGGASSAASLALVGTKRIFERLKGACNFVPPKNASWKRKGSSQAPGSGEDHDLEPYSMGMLSPTVIFSAIKRLASPPNRHDLRKMDAARERRAVAKTNGKRLSY
ncbi:hypothetical protein HOP50_09g56960 [Chloropicon primus]|uniref:Glycosyltransferase n=1 Tax=Chloropicon primus TaxID=1764295 RepID=A0A5B8MS96_9CHLO|nr:hypothetical protein A3770_09p56750 [Chloropicon primus]UPR02370.1 hypothetical protein HOP50_09g56960 [Chloropicon primus]|eukprot:QDZ23157.1 hypothetical protein A3770_09p56750 [Chloropicon primus]